MFNQLSKVAVLESKLEIYEDLSKEMLTKLEAAVDKISEGNNRIAQILTKHDERIDQSMKTDAIIIKMIDEIKLTNEKTHIIIHERIDNVQLEMKNLLKFRWQLSGVLILAFSIITVGSHFVPQLLTSQPQRVIINKQ
jgi:hypothetical protein